MRLTVARLAKAKLLKPPQVNNKFALLHAVVAALRAKKQPFRLFFVTRTEIQINLEERVSVLGTFASKPRKLISLGRRSAFESYMCPKAKKIFLLILRMNSSSRKTGGF